MGNQINIISLFTLMALLCCSESVLAKEGAKNVQLVKGILERLHTNYLEIKPKDKPFEIITRVTAIQNPKHNNTDSTRIDTTQVVTRTWVNHAFTVLSSEEGTLYYNRNQVLQIDRLAQSIELRNSLPDSALRYQTKVIRSQYTSMIDSLTDGNWILNDNLLTITKQFDYKGEAALAAQIAHVEIVVDIEKRQAVRLVTTYKNHVLDKSITEYEYVSSPRKEQFPSLKELKKDPTFKQYTFENLTVKKR